MKLILSTLLALCLVSCTFEKYIQVRETTVKVVSIDTVYRYDAYGITMPYASIKVVDERGLFFTVNPLKQFPITEQVGSIKIVYLTW